jgi:hypothetical protein
MKQLNKGKERTERKERRKILKLKQGHRANFQT